MVGLQNLKMMVLSWKGLIDEVGERQLAEMAIMPIRSTKCESFAWLL